MVRRTLNRLTATNISTRTVLLQIRMTVKKDAIMVGRGPSRENNKTIKLWGADLKIVKEDKYRFRCSYCRSPDFKKSNRSNKKIWIGTIIG